MEVPLEVAETETSTLLLPLPPTVNLYWRHILHKGKPKTLISAEGRRYKELARLAARAHKPVLYHGPIAISGVVHMARNGCDLDNRVKPMLDALHGIVFQDDVQVAHLDLIRAVDRENPRVELWVTPIQGLMDEYLARWRAKGTI